MFLTYERGGNIKRCKFADEREKIIIHKKRRLCITNGVPGSYYDNLGDKVTQRKRCGYHRHAWDIYIYRIGLR